MGDRAIHGGTECEMRARQVGRKASSHLGMFEIAALVLHPSGDIPQTLTIFREDEEF